jgi:hypothetical protein
MFINGSFKILWDKSEYSNTVADGMESIFNAKIGTLLIMLAVIRLTGKTVSKDSIAYGDADLSTIINLINQIIGVLFTSTYWKFTYLAHRF